MSKNNKVPQKNNQPNRSAPKPISLNDDTPTANAANKEVDLNYLKAFYPKPQKGMKWVYAMSINIQGMNIQGEMIMEVLDIVGEDVKIAVSIADQKHEESLNINSFAPVPNASSGKKDSTGYIYEGQENLSLPYKSLEATKLSTMSQEGRSYLWLSHGLGPVKFGISQSGIPAVLELKNFN